jgi:hypothetical protein
MTDVNPHVLARPHGARKSNRHIVDQLAAVRIKLNTLKEKERELRKIVLENDGDLLGADYTAEITVVTKEVADLQSLRAAFGADAIAPFIKRRTLYVLKTRRRDGGETFDG